jgi:proline iminopeptidase
MKILVRFIQAVGLLIGVLILAGVGLFIATAGDHSVPDTVATDPTIPHIEIDGIVFHAETFGDPQNPVVVVVHGGPGGNYGYLLNLHQLENDYFVVFYDQRGAGLSPRVDASELSLESSIADLHRIVTHYGQGERVHLVGHSWGAMLTAGYIGEHPEWVGKVVLAEPANLADGTLEEFRERENASRRFEFYRVLVPTIFETFHMEPQDADAIIDYIGLRMAMAFVGSSESGYLCAEEPVDAAEPGVPVPPSRFGATAFNAIFSASADFSQIDVNAHNYTEEVLFVAAECSTFTGEELQRAQMTMFPQARLVVIPNAGHEMIGDNPAASLIVIREYLETHNNSSKRDAVTGAPS